MEIEGIKRFEELDIERIDLDEENPNEMDNEAFNLLVEGIKEDGFVEPISVVEKGDRFEVVGGEHRLRAVRVLGVKKIPAVVLKDFDEDKKKLLTVRLNVLKGKLNPLKLSRLLERFSAKYNKEALARLIGYTDVNKLDVIYEDVKKGLPEEIKKELEKTKEEVKTIEGLSDVLNKLFSKYGATVPYNFMFFSFGGKQHVLIQCSQNTYSSVKELLAVANQKNKNASDVMFNVLKDWQKREDIWN